MPDTDTSAPAPKDSIARVLGSLKTLTDLVGTAQTAVGTLKDQVAAIKAQIEGDVEIDLAPMEQRIKDGLMAEFGTMFGSMADGLDGAVAKVTSGDDPAPPPAPTDPIVTTVGTATVTVDPTAGGATHEDASTGIVTTVDPTAGTISSVNAASVPVVVDPATAQAVASAMVDAGVAVPDAVTDVATAPVTA